jgi:hypothetical protein
LPFATIATMFAAASCGATNQHHSTPPTSQAAATPTDPCKVEVRDDRLAARVVYGGEPFLPPAGLQPRTSAVDAKRILLTNPGSSALGHRRRQEFFAIYRHLGTPRPVWVLLEHNVPGSGSLSNEIVKQDLLFILDDRTSKPMALLESLPAGCNPTEPR